MSSDASSQSKCFPSSARVRTAREYSAVFKQSERYAHPLIRIHHLRLACSVRLGLAVSRKVDRRAVNRNRIKRVLRETMRHQRAQLPPGDYVVVVQAAARQATNAQIHAAMLSLFQRIRTSTQHRAKIT